MLRNPSLVRLARRVGVASRLVALLFVVFAAAASQSSAQDRDVHYRHNATMSPGAIGSWQLQRGGPLPGYPQPVEIRAPKECRVSLAVEDQFIEPQPTPLSVGLLIAPVYRLRVTGVPFHEGEEVYPTIEVIDRLYPPPGEAWKFPIPIELSLADLELALDGRYVVRVIYLEDPDFALPGPDDPTEQRWLDAGAGNDPLQLADELGRPMAILRMGGRVPTADEIAGGGKFFYGSPPFLCPPRAMRLEAADDPAEVLLEDRGASPLPELLQTPGP